MANAFGLRNNNKLSTVHRNPKKKTRYKIGARHTYTYGQVFLTDAVTTYSDWVCLQFARAPTPTTVGSDVTSPFCSQTKDHANTSVASGGSPGVSDLLWVLGKWYGGIKAPDKMYIEGWY